MTRILQVGCGATGTALARQLLPMLGSAHRPIRYVIAGKSAPGFGTAFATRHEVHLLNVAVGSMSLHPRDPAEFCRWRIENAPVWSRYFTEPSVGWGEYPPRRLFGMYAREVLSNALAETRHSSVDASMNAEEVLGISAEGDGRWRARFASGRSEESFDFVLLALGHAPRSKFEPGIDGDGYHSNPWASENGIPREASVAILGSRLSAIDSALQLGASGHLGRIVMASRTGSLPNVKGPIGEHTLRFVPAYVADQRLLGRDGRVTLAEIASVVASEISLNDTPYARWTETIACHVTTPERLERDLELAESGAHRHWQSVLAAIVPLIPALWRLMDESGRHELSTTYRTAWMTRVASFPSVSAHRLLRMMNAGQLSVLGSLKQTSNDDDGYRLAFENSDEPLHADHVVNATGPGFGSDAVSSVPLTRCLIDDGLAEMHPGGGLRLAPETFHVLAPNGAPQPGLFLLGDFSRSVWGATNTVAGVVRQAEILAQHVASELNRRESAGESGTRCEERASGVEVLR